MSNRRFTFAEMPALARLRREADLMTEGLPKGGRQKLVREYLSRVAAMSGLRIGQLARALYCLSMETLTADRCAPAVELLEPRLVTMARKMSREALRRESEQEGERLKLEWRRAGMPPLEAVELEAA